MQEHFMPFPKTSEEWRAKAVNFAQRWDYPQCIGAIDGKHVLIEAPANTGSQYCNYKHTFSVVLLALIDAHYSFIYIDIGAYGKQSDGGIYSASTLERALSPPNSLQLPKDDVINGDEELGPMPYVVVADEAFPLQRHMMRPYPGKNTSEEQDVYNYRHSRARRIVENAFGILSQRWRMYHTKIAVMPDSVNC
ncbi:protein ALP1-like [Gigantopelta aegis]|uniref:protein ALP1-like n=1 Tax=Gigantopelta aegis TaxID=1735272 RepID=UPI001B88A5E0|nr:protein ALP1-like [Gigantopelta aegis]